MSDRYEFTIRFVDGSTKRGCFTGNWERQLARAAKYQYLTLNNGLVNMRHVLWISVEVAK